MGRVSLSTHALDTATGTPASGVRVRLYQDATLLAEADTGGDGRIAELGRDLAPGTYRIVFEVKGAFFTSAAFEVRLEEGHYHVPLLVSPYSCVTYRGS